MLTLPVTRPRWLDQLCAVSPPLPTHTHTHTPEDRNKTSHCSIHEFVDEGRDHEEQEGGREKDEPAGVARERGHAAPAHGAPTGRLTRRPEGCEVRHGPSWREARPVCHLVHGRQSWSR